MKAVLPWDPENVWGENWTDDDDDLVLEWGEPTMTIEKIVTLAGFLGIKKASRWQVWTAIHNHTLKAKKTLVEGRRRWLIGKSEAERWLSSLNDDD